MFSWQDILRTVFYAEQKASPSEDPDYPQFGEGKAFAVAQFASTLTSCRHSQLLSFLGTPLPSLQPCASACDNCLVGDKWTKVDVSATARHIVDLFLSDPVRKAGGVTNVEHIVNTLRGSKSTGKLLPSARKLGHLFGVARRVPKKTVQTVLSLLLAHGVIRGDPPPGKGATQWGKLIRFTVSNFLNGYSSTF